MQTLIRPIQREIQLSWWKNRGCYVQVYAGKLEEEVILRPEKHPLHWLETEAEDFFSLKRFAGEGNIGHMMEQIKDYGMGPGEDK